MRERANRPQWTRHLVGVAVLLVGTTTGAEAGQWEVTPFVGFRAGGSVDEIDTGFQVDFDESLVYGLSVGRYLGADKRLEAGWSRQPTTLGGRGLELDIDHLHFAGVFQLRTKGRAGGFVLASAGLTRMDLDLPGADSETRFSASIGGGARVSLGPRLALRLEARGWAVFSDSRAAVFCAGGCTFAFSADGLFQFELSSGLAIAF